MWNYLNLSVCCFWGSVMAIKAIAIQGPIGLIHMHQMLQLTIFHLAKEQQGHMSP